LLRRASTVLPIENLWVNPDCGLKTRAWDEVIPSLKNMVRQRRRCAGTVGESSRYRHGAGAKAAQRAATGEFRAVISFPQVRFPISVTRVLLRSSPGSLKSFDVHWLCQVFIKTGLQAPVDIFRHAITCQGYCRSPADFSGCPDQIDARAIRQTNVTKNDINSRSLSR
jgi:hypothetical protein